MYASSLPLCRRHVSAFHEANFGTLGTPNSLGLRGDNDTAAVSALWSGGSVEYRQDRITKSDYHAHLQEMETSDNENLLESTVGMDQNQDIGDIRYWSDFSRVYYLPRSLQKLPDPPDWETTRTDWNQGQESFSRFNEESELMDGTLRLFVEDCDNIQGIQIMNDTETFGGFMSSFLASFRDEYHKLPSFTFPVLSGAMSSNSDNDETKNARQLVNEALYLRTLNEFSSINIPILEPRLWPRSVWGGPLNFPLGSVYHQSAILSAHVETSTLPFRLKRHQRDISSICGQLNWRGPSPFGELSGIFPFMSSADFEARNFNFSSDLPIKLFDQYARLDVTRGFSPAQTGEYDKWLSRRQPSGVSYYASIHASAYPLPSSFPQFKGSNTESTSQTKSKMQPPSNILAAEVYSSLSSSGNTAKIFEKYALFIENGAKRRTASMSSINISLDDLKELVNDLWTMHDNASEENGEFSM
ncbi:hypothetical protein GALMADRAFT_245054 [Galerina marginata CBS 339.88]|uniref:DML1/Misato tubulin domain-containing protein n=1 Tax=Galerina marginata (strain CBS 339.88) TaxID=685588 RepID=A0A067T4L8_GALM3|nr:hypothetical protein GALMADRAFT_245054 [Galerina marginata CBS 339.88]